MRRNHFISKPRWNDFILNDKLWSVQGNRTSTSGSVPEKEDNNSINLSRMHTAVNDSYGTLGIPNTGIRRLQEYESTALMHPFCALGF